MPQFSSLTHSELLRHAENVRDPLATTELELEMATRLAALGDESDALEALLEEHDLDDFDALVAELKSLKAIRQKAVTVVELLTDVLADPE
jgi:hypothetical protein